MYSYLITLIILEFNGLFYLDFITFLVIRCFILFSLAISMNKLHV